MNELCTCVIKKNSQAATPLKRWVHGRGQHAINVCYTLLVTNTICTFFSHVGVYYTPKKDYKQKLYLQSWNKKHM